MNNYVSKVDYLYQEYSKHKEDNKDFVNIVISNNNQINESFNSMSINNNNNMKLDKMEEEINILKESIRIIENESKNKMSIMKNNSDNNLEYTKKLFNNEISQIKNLLNAEIEKNKSMFKDIQVTISELYEQNMLMKNIMNNLWNYLKK